MKIFRLLSSLKRSDFSIPVISVISILILISTGVVINFYLRSSTKMGPFGFNVYNKISPDKQYDYCEYSPFFEHYVCTESPDSSMNFQIYFIKYLENSGYKEIIGFNLSDNVETEYQNMKNLLIRKYGEPVNEDIIIDGNTNTVWRGNDNIPNYIKDISIEHTILGFGIIYRL